MKLAFTKMHGLGNDFVVFDGVRQEVALSPDRIREIADRRRGIGCDQVLIVAPARAADADFFYRIFNQDGSEVDQCGNGARCIAKFLHAQGIDTRSHIRLETRAGRLELAMEDDGQVTVNMGAPRFEPAEIPFHANARALRYALDVNGQTLEIGAVSMGNPHAVIRVDNVDNAPVEHLGPRIERHERFPEHVNAGFMQIIDRTHLRLRVFERGVGETQACGSGACAAVAVAREQGLLDVRVTVALRGGELVISWAGDAEPLYMTGPATSVFEGHIES